MQDLPDQQLIAAYLRGDEESLEILISRYLKPIYSFVYRHVGDAQEAEDITQQVFVKVWRNLKKFDQQKSFKPWIFAIAKNASIDSLKKSRSASGGKKEIPFSKFESAAGINILTETLADPAVLPDKLFEQKNIAQTLYLAMENLSVQYRMVLFLRYNDHFTFREISESLEEPLHTVKSRHRRALIQLKKLLIET